MPPLVQPTRYGTFVSRAGYLGTSPVVASPDHGPPGRGTARDVWLRLEAAPGAPISAAFLYWGWHAPVIRPGQDLLRVANAPGAPFIGGQAVGHRTDPDGAVDLVVYRSDLTRMLHDPRASRRLGDEGLLLQGMDPTSGERALTPTLVVLLEQDDSAAVTWMFDGASASAAADRRPFTGLGSCCHGGVEYALHSPGQRAPRRAARWTSISVTGSIGFDPCRRQPRSCSEVGVATYDVTAFLGEGERGTQLEVGQRNVALPPGSTSTTLVDLVWID